MKHKLFTFLFALMVAGAGTLFAESGTCGDNLTWDLTDGVLTISGTGAMYNYEKRETPWDDYRASIHSVIINDGVTTIGNHAFYYCTDITSVEIPNGVTSIGWRAFNTCKSLTSIDIPNSVTSISSEAFAFCSSLSSVSIGKSVTIIGSNAFLECKELTSVNINDIAAWCIIRFERAVSQSENTQYANPLYYAGNLYLDNTLVEDLVIPNGVTEIAFQAFADCKSITSVTIPEGVTSLGKGAFLGCSNLSSIKLPASLTDLGTYAFASCTSLTSVEIPKNVTIIGEYTFSNCTNLTSVVIPSSVTYLGYEAFAYCKGLTSFTDYATTPQKRDDPCFTMVTLANATLYVPAESIALYKAYPNWAEFGTIKAIEDESGTEDPCLIASGTCGENLTWELSCDSVLTISGEGEMWSGEENLGWRQYLSHIRTVILPDGLTAIAPQAFYNCTNLQSVNVPNSVHAIGHKAFVGCESLTKPVYNATIFAFMPRNYCGAYSIPEGIVSVAAYAFSGVVSNSCGLTGITIPSSVKRLGDEALGAPLLRKITCSAATPPVCDGNTFMWLNEEFGVTLAVKDSIPVYVPAESVEAYKAADGWNYFTNIQAIDSEEPSVLTIAEAIEIGMALDSMATSEETYTIEGYVINATAFNQTARNQSWYMADDENASSSSFQAYTCYALEGTTKTAVTNGCKVRMTGNLHKYYNKASATYTVEMKKTPATILSLPQTETISVAQATAIGMALDSMATTIEFYTVEGYVINASTVNQTTHSQNWYMADDENASSSSFQVYRGYTIEGTDTISVQNGYKVRVTSYLHKYYNQQTAKYVVEMLNTKATILSRPSIDTITVAQALAIGAELAEGASTQKQYVIRGYISYVHIPFDSEYGNQSFYISDDSTAFAIYNANGGFYVYRGKPETGSALPEGTLVEFTCSIKNYNGQNIENAEQNITIKVLREAPECRDLKGSCGENVTWTLNTCEGHLIISGTGPTVSYSARSVSPFQYFNVQSVTIEEGVSGLGKYFFYGCTMPTITLPASLDSISVSALNRCPNLTSIEVADGNTHFSSVDGVLFSKDKTTLFRFPTGRAGEYVIPEGTVTIGYGAFNACYEVSSVIIPNTVTTLEEAAFYACQSINSIIIPEGVSSIGNVAFTHCSSLSSIIISSSVEHIGDGAFVNCSQLASITNYAVVPQYLDPDGDSVFGGVSLDCKLYVPAESVDDYKAADVWKDFYNILPIQAEETETNTTVVTPGTNSADVVWPQVDGAYTYELVIKDKNGNVICTLVFNSNGQLTQIAFNAPARGDAPQKEQSVGFSFTITGLSSGTAYELTLTAKDSNESTLDTQTLSFTTQSPQGIEETNDDAKATKFMRDGQVLILRGDKIYTVTGQEVK